MLYAIALYLIPACIVFPVALDDAAHLSPDKQWWDAIRLALLWPVGVLAFGLAILLIVMDRGE